MIIKVVKSFMIPVQVPVTYLPKVWVISLKERGIKSVGWGNWQRDEFLPRVKVEVNTGNTEKDQRIAYGFLPTRRL
jgi:hypothetical protein